MGAFRQMPARPRPIMDPAMRSMGVRFMKVYSFAHARALSRQFFPTWSRRARARWVLAKLRAYQPKVFQRSSRA
jgi:hypothetical protein